LVLERMKLSLGLVVSSLAILQLVNVDLATAFLSQGIAVSILVLFLLGTKPGMLSANRQRLKRTS